MKTMVIMVPIVITPKIEATTATCIIFCLAAGYIISGISGSQGPKTNIVKRIQGVRLTDFEG